MPFSPSPSFNYLPIWNKFDCGGYKKMVIRGLGSIWLLTGVWVISEKKVQTDFKRKKFLLRNSKEIPTLPFWPELNLPFLANITGLCFRLIFSQFLTLLPISFPCLTSIFLAWFLAVFLWFLSHFHPLSIRAWACDNFGWGNALMW